MSAFRDPATPTTQAHFPLITVPLKLAIVDIHTAMTFVHAVSPTTRQATDRTHTNSRVSLSGVPRSCACSLSPWRPLAKQHLCRNTSSSCQATRRASTQTSRINPASPPSCRRARTRTHHHTHTITHHHTTTPSHHGTYTSRNSTTHASCVMLLHSHRIH